MPCLQYCEPCIVTQIVSSDSRRHPALSVYVRCVLYLFELHLSVQLLQLFSLLLLLLPRCTQLLQINTHQVKHLTHIRHRTDWVHFCSCTCSRACSCFFLSSTRSASRDSSSELSTKQTGHNVEVFTSSPAAVVHVSTSHFKFTPGLIINEV